MFMSKTPIKKYSNYIILETFLKLKPLAAYLIERYLQRWTL